MKAGERETGPKEGRECGREGRRLAECGKITRGEGGSGGKKRMRRRGEEGRYRERRTHGDERGVERGREREKENGRKEKKDKARDEQGGRKTPKT